MNSCGGEGMDHSSVAPCQGSAAAVRGPRKARSRFAIKTTNESPRMNEPTVSTRFQNSNPRPSG